MLEPQEAIAALQFLERCSIQGTQERRAMDQVCYKLGMIANPQPEESPKDDIPGAEIEMPAGNEDPKKAGESQKKG